jgi:hypothetical protein
LLLFYAISQASRAIVAMLGDRPEITSHGIAEDRSVQSDDLLHRRFVPAPRKDGTDAFGAVARAIGSATIRDGVEIGAVWAALPDSYGLPRESWRADWRLALDAGIDKPIGHSDGVLVPVASFGGNPLVGAIDTLGSGRYPTIPPRTAASLRGGREVEPGGWIADLQIPELEEEADVVLDRLAPRRYDGRRRSLMLMPDPRPLIPGSEYTVAYANGSYATMDSLGRLPGDQRFGQEARSAHGREAHERWTREFEALFGSDYRAADWESRQSETRRAAARRAA